MSKQNAPGVYKTKKKDGSVYYRCSLTVKRKHISLGSYNTEEEAAACYKEARAILGGEAGELPEAPSYLPYQKFITLLNLKVNGIYFPNPIFLKKNFFEYHLSPDRILKFDRDDLFFYASHKIQIKGGYLFVCDYGSQYKILKRYGIKPFAVEGRDYVLINGDTNDYRYSNIRVLSNYVGVRPTYRDPEQTVPGDYKTMIHINGDYLVGRYPTEEEAAVAYNKAVDTLKQNGFKKGFITNYIERLSKEEYKKLYDSLDISKKLTQLKAAPSPKEAR